jgi:luciferase family oxidoreductase group 1
LKLSVLDQSPVSLGSGLPEALNSSIQLARLADRLHYSRYWVAEHHMLSALASPAPEVLLARVAADTHHIRLGSGGVMLPHYSALKVAEVFLMLNALAPGRVDLGVGRAPGGGPLEAFALRRERLDRPLPDDFNEQLTELQSYFDRDFPADHPFRRIQMPADGPGGSILWLLGSSMWSAVTAAARGLPYAFAHFFSGEDTRAAISHYQSRFVASKHHPRPRATIAVSVICADSPAEAEYLAASVRLLRQRLHSGGGIGPLEPPEQALRALAAAPAAPSGRRNEWPALIVGTPDSVRAALQQMAQALGLDELMVVTMTFDPRARLRSYELLAQAFDLGAAGA